MSDEPVSRGVCDANVQRVLDKIDGYHADVMKLDKVVHGSSGRNGLVRDVQWNKDAVARASAFRSVVTGVLSSVVTALIIYFFIPFG